MVIAGLSTTEALRRLRRDGPNELPPPRRDPAIVQLLGQLVHFFALMLWSASVLAWWAGMPQLSVAICVVVVVNGVFAFVQERRSDHAADRLRAMLPRRVLVRRDGDSVEIDARDVVVGDLMLLSAGDRISADAVVVVDRGLRVDTSMLTGESEPAGVDASREVYAGSFVVDGEAEAEVTSTGRSTRFAEIAALTNETRRPQRPLTREINRVVRTISIIAVTVGVACLLLALAIGLGTDASDAVVFAIGVTVALVPEGLLPTVTLSLAIGAQRMAANHALVRHLDAVETLGSTTFICTDKTGTLTENRMTVLDVWTPDLAVHIDGVGYGPTAAMSWSNDGDRRSVDQLVLGAARCGTGRAILRDEEWEALGDPMEAAIDACARRLGRDIEQDRRCRSELARFPFDAVRKRVCVVLASERGGAEVIVKGAVETVLPLCLGNTAPLACEEQIEVMTGRGLRVIAVAHRSIATGPPPLDVDDAERGLQLLGIIGLLDPPRDSARDALRRCREAGIKVAMVTGDHPATAIAIADQVGLSHGSGTVLLGRDLPADLDQLGELIDHDGIVISRASPSDKLRIAQALNARGHVVAMTGDGVNDGPALRAANIGVAMGRTGTDVAREAADVVLLDDDFATIVDAVAQGRATFLNVRRFLTYHLTDNVAELTPYIVWAMSGGRIPLALTVMQILALDIGTDTLSATALGAEPPSSRVVSGPPVSGRLLNHTVALRAFAILGPTEASVSLAAFFTAFLVAGWTPGESFPGGAVLAGASGAAFLAVVLGQKANAWACRSVTEPAWRLGWLTNRLLVYTAVAELAFAAACLTVPPVRDALDHRVPPLAAALVAVGSVPVVFVVDTLYKARRSSAPGVVGERGTARSVAAPGR